MMTNDLFFPLLSRRTNYSRKRDGSYYLYEHYRKEVSEDCKFRCVYCDIHINECGGAESMHLDHFRPQIHFDHLLNDPHNLVLACPGCNRLKSDNWPAVGVDECYIGDEGFIDPFIMNRLEFLQIEEDGQVTGLKPPAKYQISLLQLNRRSRRLIRLWRLMEFHLIDKLSAEADRAEALITSYPDFPPEAQEELHEMADNLRAYAKSILDRISDSWSGK